MVAIVLYICKMNFNTVTTMFRLMSVRLFASIACLVVSVSAAYGQEVYGTPPVGGTLLAPPPAAWNVDAPPYLRDSLAFAMHVRRIVPVAQELPRLRMADSMAVAAVTVRTVSRLSPAFAMPVFTRSPYAFDYSSGGAIASWRGGALVGSSFRTTMPGLVSVADASVGVVQGVGNLTLNANVSADRYLLWRGTRTFYNVSGALSYRFNDNWSATVFGRYSSNRSFFSMAAMPYMGTSGYGGFVTFMGETVGIDVGVERYYDTFARRWVTSPIITPKIKVAEKFTIELPVGWMVKEILDNAVHNRKKRGGPMIMPTGVPSVGEIPFGTPEMPR